MTSLVAVGDLIANKYRVERVLGRGGMGIVVAAVHVHLGQHVALKFLLPTVGTSPAIVARFEREARAAVALHSDHVTRVLDVGRLPDGAPYMVMEMLEGRDLAQELRSRRRLPAHEAVAHLVQACDAIAEAHALGIIHRDIKPANLFLAQRPKRVPTIKVLDFGISRSIALTEGVADITNTSQLIGSPLYMSPEQLRAPKTVDERSDIWSLGATLFELLSGEPPFNGETVAELGAHIIMTPLVGIRSRQGCADIPEGLADVIARCLEKDPDRRYATIDDLMLALAPFARTEAITAAPGPASAPDAEQNPMATTTQPTSPGQAHAGQTLPLLPAPASTVENPQATSEAAVSYPPPAPPVERAPRRGTFVTTGLIVAICALLAIVAMRELSRTASPPSPASSPSVAAVPSTETRSSEPAPSTIAAPPPATAASAPSSSSVVATVTSATRPLRPGSDTTPKPSAAPSSQPAPSASVAPNGSASPLKGLHLE